jgi:ArsR family transcriptional regulator
MERTTVTFNKEHLKTSVEMLRALAHPLRLKILEYIDRQGTVNVNKIYHGLNIEQSVTSQHLRIMRLAGVLNARREGKFVYYSIHYPTVLQAEKAMKNFMAAEKPSNIER